VRRNRPSRSALKVVQAIAFLAQEPEVAALLPPGLAETNERLLLGAKLMKPAQLRRLANPRVRRFVYFVDSLGAHGQMLFVGLRKRLVHDEVMAAIARGTRQLLVIGGGVDTLTWRIAQAHPEVLAVEVDHPASQGRKLPALAVLGPQPANLRLLPVDLAHDDLASTLEGVPGWSREAPTLAIAEAVLLYVDPAAVSRALRQLHAACGPGSALLFSYLRRDARGRFLLGKRPRLAAFALAASGEPLRWGVAPGELASFLAAAGWRLEVERHDLRERYLEPAGLGARALADIEVYALARRD
jgi:methyltransferase (TIGR00027 family)